MFSYHVQLALRSLHRMPILSLLSCLIIAIGIAACTTMLAIQQAMSGDPFPSKSDRVFHVQIDTRIGQARIGRPLDTLTYSDADELLTLSLGAVQKAVTFSSLLSVASVGGSPRATMVRGVSAGFFSLFQVPIEKGAAWGLSGDEEHDRVAIISKELNDRMFDGRGMGRLLLIGGKQFTVIGVMAPWSPAPKFFDLTGGAFAKVENIFIPVAAAVDIPAVPSSMVCWGDPGLPSAVKTAPCGWLNAWVQLKSARDGPIFQQTIANQLRDAGLDDANERVVIMPLRQWLDYKQVVPTDVRIQTVLAFVFLLLCTVNVAGLLMLKYRDKSAQLAIRMALGASRLTIAGHILTESIIVGAAGTTVGMLAGMYCLHQIRERSSDYASIVHLSYGTAAVIMLIGLTVVALAGSIAVVRVYRVQPARLMGG